MQTVCTPTVLYRLSFLLNSEGPHTSDEGIARDWAKEHGREEEVELLIKHRMVKLPTTIPIQLDTLYLVLRAIAE